MLCAINKLYLWAMKTVTLTFSIAIYANPQKIFEYVSNWEKQSDWILFTKVKLLQGTPNQKDSLLLAVTKFGPLKVADTMIVTDWEPYERIVVEHTGRIVFGKGIFTIKNISKELSTFTWQEITPILFGFIGQFGLVLVKPVINIVFGKFLMKLKDNIETSEKIK